MNDNSAFNLELFESLVHSRSLELGRSVIFRAVATSTNDVALAAMADGAPHGLVVVADHQTSGRGRRGRAWMSVTPAENLLFSVVLRLSSANETFSNITLAIGLALRAALQPSLDHDVRLKWTNDVLVQWRKLAGILVESQLRGSEPYLVVGIGLNVHMREPPAGLGPIATSMCMLDSRVMSRERLLADILEELAVRIRTWQTGGFARMADEYRACDALRGHRVAVDGLQGIAHGIDEDGALLLKVEDELQPRRLLNGTVEILEFLQD